MTLTQLKSKLKKIGYFENHGFDKTDWYKLPSGAWVHIRASIRHSNIGDGTIVMSQTLVQHSTIGKNCIIWQYATISNAAICNNVKIEPWSTIGHLNTLTTAIARNSNIPKESNLSYECNSRIAKSTVKGLNVNPFSILCEKRMVKIGCKLKTIEQWLKVYKRVGKEHYYDEDQIELYHKALLAAKKYLDKYYPAKEKAATA